MDRLLCNPLRVTHGTFVKKLFSGCGKTFRTFETSLSRRNTSYVGQLTSINPQNEGICQKCIFSRYGLMKDLKTAKVSNHFRKELAALTSVILRSDLSHSHLKSKSNTWLPIREEWIRLFRPSGSSCQKEDKNGDGKHQDNNEDPSGKDNEDENWKRNEFIRSLFSFFAVILLAWILTPNPENDSENQKYISWNEFYHNLLLKGEVKKIFLLFSASEDGESLAIIEVHDGAVIKGIPASRNRYWLKIPKGFKFEERIRQVEDELGLPVEERITIEYKHPNSWTMLAFRGFVIVALLLFIRHLFSMYTKASQGTDFMDAISGGLRRAKFTRADAAAKKGGKAISFKDVAGLKEAKIEVMEFVDYLTKPERFKTLGAKTPRGALLLGPPGCGKTLLARALATEAQVPFLAMAGSEFVEMIGGVGAARVRNLFKEAREKAPCIIYIDEIDAVGRKRGGSGTAGGGEDEHTLNQLLVEMDGIGTQEGVIMLAATNRADILDKALLRPGRFDRHIMIDLPTLIEREEIFNVYLEKLQLTQPPSVFAKPLSRLTPGMSGADISNIVNEAAIHAARDKKSSVEKENFEYAVERVIAGAQKKTGLLSPSEKKVVAYHESGHALVGWMLKYTDALLRISIVPRTNSALGFAQYLPSDQKLYSKEELFERMCMALGGRAAESLIFNHVSTGAHDDLQRVTKMAYDQIRSYGMNERVGYVSFPGDGQTGGTKPYSQSLAAAIDEESRMLVTKAFLHTQKVLEENKDKLHELATKLLEKEVLTYEDVQALIGPPVHGKKHVIEPHGWEGIMPSSRS